VIRINLLQEEEVRNKLELFDQLRIGLYALAAVIVAIIFLSYSITGSVKTAAAQLDELQAELNRLNRKGVERKDKKFKRLKSELETKIDIIWELKSQQAGPVHLLDGVSRNLPDRVWLSSMQESVRGVTIKGYAYSNVDVAQFMTNLENSDLFSGVELVQSGQSNVAEQKVMVFSLKMKYTAPKGWLVDESKNNK
jgi:type IV pilus assembly protein PilN